MANDYGLADFTLTKHMKAQLLEYENLDNPGSSTSGESMYFECRGCDVANGNGGNENGNRERKARVMVQHGRIITNPTIGHRVGCQPLAKAEVEVLRISRDARKRCRDEGAPPLLSYQRAVNEIPRRLPDQEEQGNVAMAMPPYKKIRSSLYRHVNHRIIPMADVNNLPQAYTITWASREAMDHDPRDPNLERFLLYQDETMIVFSTDSDLRALGQSEYVVGDGTFEMVPNAYMQLYTLHGFINGEALPLCHTLLKNKRRETYVRLFTVIRDRIAILLEGEQDIDCRLMFDFEMAVHQAAEDVFHVTPLGCIFHLGQCLIRWIQNNGLKNLYENENSGLRQWLHMVKAMALLPLDLVNVGWNHLQGLRPRPAEPLYRDRLESFVVYFENTWLFGFFHAERWNHFDNAWRRLERLRNQPGPRTTNHAEGWHSKLNHEFGRPHPALNVFLDWLQRTNHVTQVRILQLQNGANPRPRDARYTEVDIRIFEAKKSPYPTTQLPTRNRCSCSCNTARSGGVFETHRSLAWMTGESDDPSH